MFRPKYHIPSLTRVDNPTAIATDTLTTDRTVHVHTAITAATRGTVAASIIEE